MTNSIVANVDRIATSAVNAGALRRLRRLFRHADGRAILTPMDHGLYSGPMAGIEDPLQIARQVVPGSDGLLTSPGFARTIAAELPSDRALVLRAGCATELSPLQTYEAIYLSIETALRYDADAVIHSLYLGTDRDQDAIRNAGKIIEAADRYQVPVIVEFLPAREDWTAKEVAQWARLGYELGGSAVKTIYTGDPESYALVVSGCPVPILIAGGPAVGTLADLLHTIAGAIAAGAAGTAIGRRVWQSKDPAALLDVMGQIVHGQISVHDGLTALERGRA